MSDSLKSIHIIIILSALLLLLTLPLPAAEAAGLIQDLRVNGIAASDMITVQSNSVLITATVPSDSLVAINEASGTSWGEPDENGEIGYQVDIIVPGENVIEIYIFDLYTGVAQKEILRVIYDNGQPYVYRLEPSSGSEVYTSSVTVKGFAYRAASLKINGINVSLDSDSKFSHQLTLSPGQNTISINSGTGTHLMDYRLTYTTGPGVEVSYPYDGYDIWDFNFISVYGNVNPNTRQLFVRNSSLQGSVDTQVTIKADKSYITGNIHLKPGANVIVLTAKDASGNTKVEKFTVNYKGEPGISISSPANGATIVSPSVTISGRVERIKDGGFEINRQAVAVDSQGFFSHTINLVPFDNYITLSASDETRTISALLYLYYDPTPYITVTSPGTSNSLTYTLRGKVYNTDTLKVNGSVVTINSDKTFSTTVKLTKSQTDITLRAIKGAQVVTEVFEVDFTGRPTITISSPTPGKVFEDDWADVSGVVLPVDVADFTVTCNGETEDIAPNDSGSFTTSVSLVPGDNKISFSAVLGALTTNKDITVKYDTSPRITVDDITDKMTVYSNKLTVSGTVENAVEGSLKINNVSVKFDSSGDFSHVVYLKPGSNNVTLIVSGEAKSKSGAGKTKTYIVYYNDVAKKEAEVELTVKRGEKVTAFSGLVTIETAKDASLENKVEMRVVDPDDIEGPLYSSAFVGPVIDVDFDEDPEQFFKITMKYDEIINEAQARKVTVMYYDETWDKWIILGGIVDPVNKTITLRTDKEGKFVAATYYKNFDDVTYHWGKRDIEYLVAQGVASGLTENRFNPDGIITRAEFTVFLAKACGLKPYEPAVNSFDDVDADHWAFSYVETAARAGIVSGVTSRRFSPSQWITREQAAIMLARAAGAKLIEESKAAGVLANFTDGGSVGVYANLEVASVIELGMMKGMPDSSFRPRGTTTRAQAVAMVVRLVEYLEKDSQSGKKTKKTR